MCSKWYIETLAIVEHKVQSIAATSHCSNKFSSNIKNDLNMAHGWNDKLRVASCELWVAILRKSIYELRVTFYEL